MPKVSRRNQKRSLISKPSSKTKFAENNLNSNSAKNLFNEQFLDMDSDYECDTKSHESNGSKKQIIKFCNQFHKFGSCEGNCGLSHGTLNDHVSELCPEFKENSECPRGIDCGLRHIGEVIIADTTNITSDIQEQQTQHNSINVQDHESEWEQAGSKRKQKKPLRQEQQETNNNNNNNNNNKPKTNINTDIKKQIESLHLAHNKNLTKDVIEKPKYLSAKDKLFLKLYSVNEYSYRSTEINKIMRIGSNDDLKMLIEVMGAMGDVLLMEYPDTLKRASSLLSLGHALVWPIWANTNRRWMIVDDGPLKNFIESDQCNNIGMLRWAIDNNICSRIGGKTRYGTEEINVIDSAERAYKDKLVSDEFIRAIRDILNMLTDSERRLRFNEALREFRRHELDDKRRDIAIRDIRGYFKEISEENIVENLRNIVTNSRCDECGINEEMTQNFANIIVCLNEYQDLLVKFTNTLRSLMMQNMTEQQKGTIQFFILSESRNNINNTNNTNNNEMYDMLENSYNNKEIFARALFIRCYKDVRFREHIPKNVFDFFEQKTKGKVTLISSRLSDVLKAKNTLS